MKWGLKSEISIDADSGPLTQYDEPDLNKSQKSRPTTPTASKVIPLGTRITIV